MGFFVTVMVAVASAQNHVLSLDGDGDYVRIENAPELQGGENVVKTIEAWFMSMRAPFTVIGKARDGTDKDWVIRLNGEGELYFWSEKGGDDYQPQMPVALAENQWHHVAAVIDRPQRLLRLYLNGVLIIEELDMPNQSATTEAPIEVGALAYSGEYAKGYIDEVRIWKVARTEAQIRETMLTRLRGDEPGLVGYWTFEDKGEKALDATSNGHHGEMVGDAKRVLMKLPSRVRPVEPPAFLSVVVTDEGGNPLSDATVFLEQAGKRIAEGKTSSSGRYHFSAYPVPGGYKIYTIHGKLGDWKSISQKTTAFRQGERQTLSLTLKPAMPALIAALGDADDRVRQNAAWMLAEFGESATAAAPALKQTLNDSSGKVRSYAVLALAKLNELPHDVAPALMESVLADESDEIRRDVTKALGQMGVPPTGAIPALTKALVDESDEVRHNAAGALGQLGSAATAAVPALIQTLNDENEGVRWKAAWALKRIGIPETMENVYELAEKAHTLLWVGILMAIGVVHLLLFLFYPKSVNNLYYAIWVGNIIVFMGLGVIFFPVAYNSPLHRAMFIIAIGIALSGLRFLYALFYTRLPRQFWVFLAVWVYLAVGLCFTPALQSYNGPLQIFLVGLPLVLFILGACVEVLRVLLVAIIKKKDGAWLISIGFMAMVSVFIAWGVNILTLQDTPLRFVDEEVIGIAWTLAVIGLLVSVSAYLARNFARTHRALEAKNQQISVLNEQLKDENLRMSAELEVTEKIQRLILPTQDELKAIADLDIAGYMAPAHEVGGDYYDVLQQDERLKIAIGDVTGHGLESGMVMLMTQSVVRALLRSGETDPVRFLDTLNHTIYNNVQRMDSDKNLTLCLLDYADGEVKLSGQHEEMIVVRRDGKIELVDTIDLGFPIGLDDEIADFIDQTTVQLQSGDGVVLYTDGITEAENTDGEQYGLERLCEVVSRHWSQSAEAIKEAVVADVLSFIGEGEIYDDITLVVLKQK